MTNASPPFAGYAARWCATLHLESVPEPVLKAARRAILDTVAVGVAGRATHAAMIAESLTAAQPASDRRLATRWGGGRLPAAAAAYCNATAGHALDMDDTCFSGIVHGSVALVPTSLAEAESVGQSGRAVLESFIAGSEITYALGASVGSALYDAGWWPTAFLGAVGAAAAIGKLRGWAAGDIARAMVFAGLGASGCRAGTGTDAKPLGVGETTARAFRAAQLSQSAASVPLDLFERSDGPLRSALGDRVRNGPARTLGSTWRLLEPGLVVKPYPLCSSAQAAVEATIALAARRRIDPEEVLEISALVTPMVRDSLRYDRPADENQAMFSLPYAIACALADGVVGPEHLSRASLARADLGRLMDRVRIESDAEAFDRSAAPEAARISIATKDGGYHQRTCLFAAGDPRAPLSATAFEAKVRRCLGSVFEGRRVTEIVDLSDRIDTLQDIGTFTSLLEIA